MGWQNNAQASIRKAWKDSFSIVCGPTLELPRALKHDENDYDENVDGAGMGDELEHFTTVKKWPIPEGSVPFWESQMGVFTPLSAWALTLLAAPPTSDESERAFSAKMTITDRRHSLAPEVLEAFE